MQPRHGGRGHRARRKSKSPRAGLNATVIQDYYAIVAAQRKLANPQTSVGEAERFLDITQKQEKGGEVAHADVIKAQIDLQQRQRDLQDAQLAIEKAKIALGVLIFPGLQLGFHRGGRFAAAAPCCRRWPKRARRPPPPAPISRPRRRACRKPGTKSSVARYQYLPSLGLDFFYGIDANQFAEHTVIPPGDGPQHAAELSGHARQNLGYAAQATLNIPVWNWGATRSKIKQAELKRDQAQLDLVAGAADLAKQPGRRLRRGAGARRRRSNPCAVASISPPRACA